LRLFLFEIDFQALSCIIKKKKINMISFSQWKENPQLGLHYYAGWDEQMFEALENAKKHPGLLTKVNDALNVAKKIIKQSPKKLGVVCGPISTGKRTVEENLRIFELTILKVSNTMPVFNQMPFEPVFETMHSLVFEDKDLCPSGKSSEFFIDYFYREVFLSNKNWVPHFIYGWEHSVGASMEHRIFTQLGSDIVYLSEDFVTI
jgi:hypothetical protein